MLYTRRELARLALTAIPAARLLSPWSVSGFQAKPDSKVRGVIIGMNVPYNFGGRSMPVDQIIQNCVQLGVSGVELRTQPVEAFLGVPEQLVTAGQGGGPAAPPPTPEQEAARKANAEELRKWRLSVPMEKVRSVRKLFDDAGVFVEIVKVDGIFAMTDDVVDYEFALAKNLGARAISTEIAVPDTKRLGQFADKHQMMVGYNGHATTSAADF